MGEESGLCRGGSVAGAAAPRGAGAARRGLSLVKGTIYVAVAMGCGLLLRWIPDVGVK